MVHLDKPQPSVLYARDTCYRASMLQPFYPSIPSITRHVFYTLIISNPRSPINVCATGSPGQPWKGSGMIEFPYSIALEG